MNKEIRLNAFDMNCVGHIQHGMWTHPRDRSTEYNTIQYWQDLARLAERGKFDGIFLADIVGVYDVYRGGPAPSIVDAVQIPVNDPMMVVPVMAAVTEHIGFGVTANLTYEPPYLFARRMSTLDHLTRGRVGWNIVTGYLDSAARGMGLAAQPDHDGRYDAADEYMSVVYQLWEASWEEGAVRRDKSNRIFADPAKIHRVRHNGRRHHVDAIHLAEPSPQRTPVLYQAGSSTRGREFAATHAECVFVFGADKRITGDIVADIRGRAAAHGRDPKDILIFYNRRRRRPHPARGRGEVPGISPARQHRGGAGAFLELHRPRLLAIRAGRADPLRQERLDQLGGRDPDDAECRALDVAADRRPDGAGQPQPGHRRLGRGGRRRPDRLGRENRYRRLQPQPHRDPGGSRRLCRPGRAHPAGARRLQARLPARHLAREAVRRVAAAAREPPGCRAPSGWMPSAVNERVASPQRPNAAFQ
jgi:alkanesulfonate monooxygenase SsuD/methylene tetrahydromethanopterin reductase-like flavin-dependent oxidoreductase (luciferase family)